MTGRVVSTKVKGTAVVLVERKAIHKLYKKSFVRTKKYLVDDSIGVKDGDIIEIEKIRPISKRKHWKVVKVLGRSFAEIAEEHLKEKAEEAIGVVMPAEPKSKDIVEPESQEAKISDNKKKKTEAPKKAKAKKESK